MASFSRSRIRPWRWFLAAALLMACGDEDASQPPAPGAGGTASAGAAGNGGSSGGSGGSSAGSSAGGAGGSNAAGQGAGGSAPPGCVNANSGTCCAVEECYTPEKIVELGCSPVDLQVEGCPHPVELPSGNCHWYEASSKTEDGKCCYTYYSGDCCGP